MDWLADRQTALLGAIAATFNALVLLRVVHLDGQQVAGLNGLAAAWLGVLVMPKKKVANRVKAAQADAHAAGYDKAVVDMASLAAPPPTKTVAKKAAKQK